MLTVHDVGSVVVPRFKEFTVEKLFEILKGKEDILKYLPDYAKGKRMPPRTFCFNVVNHVAPHYIEQAVEAAKRARMPQVKKVKNLQPLVIP